MTQSLLYRIACVAIALSVALGAFGAHGLKSRLGEDYTHYGPIWDTAATYQMYNALGLLALAALWGLIAGPRVGPGAWLVIAGTCVFAASLYALVLTKVGWLGAITPIGGVLMIVGWVLIATASFSSNAQG